MDNIITDIKKYEDIDGNNILKNVGVVAYMDDIVLRDVRN